MRVERGDKRDAEGAIVGATMVDAPLDFQLLFEHSPDVLLVLLPDAPRYTMVAATKARFAATHTTPDTIGRGLFELFPDNPDDPAADGTANLRSSLDRVLATQAPDTMAVQKYDIRGPDGTFEAKSGARRTCRSSRRRARSSTFFIGSRM